MKKKFENSGFAAMYIWMTAAKYTMGMFFVAYVVFYLALGYFSESGAKMLDFITAIQMIFACFFIGLAQQIIVPEGKLTRARSVLFILVGTALTTLFALGFSWLQAFPLWCTACFLLVTPFGIIALLVAYYIQLYRETRTLNEQLEHFQRSSNRDTQRRVCHDQD